MHIFHVVSEASSYVTEKKGKSSSRTSCEKCSQCEKKGRKRKDISAGVEQKNFPGKTVLGNLGENKVQHGRQRSEGGGQKKIKTGKENFAVFDYTSDGATQSNCEVSLDEGISGNFILQNYINFEI